MRITRLSKTGALIDRFIVGEIMPGTFTGKLAFGFYPHFTYDPSVRQFVLTWASAGISQDYPEGIWIQRLDALGWHASSPWIKS